MHLPVLARAVQIAAACVLAGCATYINEPVQSNPRMKTVVVEGQSVMVAPYSDGTWGATTSLTLNIWMPKNPAAERPRLIRSVEQVSGCKVVDAQYVMEHDLLTAAVDCKLRP